MQRKWQQILGVIDCVKSDILNPLHRYGRQHWIRKWSAFLQKKEWLHNRCKSVWVDMWMWGSCRISLLIATISKIRLLLESEAGEETYEVFGDIKGYLIVIMESGKLTELLAWLLNSAKGPLGAHLVSCWVPIWTETNEHDYVFLQYFWCPGATKIKWKVGFSQEVGFDKLMQQHRDKLEIECKLH